MQDLSSISRALNEVVNSPVPNEENLTQTIERFLSSNDPAVRVAAVRTLHAIIYDDKSGQIEARRRMILGETALTIIPALLPILSASRHEVEELLYQSASYGRPREVVMSLNEALQQIEERAEQVELSDEEENEEDEVNYNVLAKEFETVINCYRIAISRLANKKSTSTILALSDAVSPVLSGLYQELDVDLATRILHQICQLVSTAWQWTQTTEDVGGEQKAILGSLLFMAITLLGPKTGSGMLEHWFLKTFPKYNYLRKDSSESISTTDAAGSSLGSALVTSHNIDIQSTDLRDRLINPSSTSPYSALAALILLSIQATYETAETNPPTIADCMPVLSAALSSVAVDAGCTFVWSLIHRGATVDFDSATMLFELLMPLIAVPANDTTRTALVKLLEAIIQTQETDSKLMLFKQLLEPENPFDSIRLSTFPILRQQLISDPSLLSSSTYQALAPILFTLPVQDDTPVLNLSLEEMVSTMYPSWFTECSNLLWFLYDLDKDNRTGIRDEMTLAKIKGEWLGPIERRLEVLKTEAEGLGQDAVQVRFVIERWSDAVQRASIAIGE